MTGKDRLPSALRARTVALLAATVLALTACATAATTATSTPSPATSSPAAAVLATSARTSYDPSSEPIVQVVRRVTPAVVTVTSTTQSGGNFFTGTSTSEAVGTGFV